jgi:L-aspartate oxidase
MSVQLLVKRTLMESNTRYAQGGVAGVQSEADNFDLHIQDTLEAGCGLCHEEVVQRVVEHGPSALGFLEGLGVQFDRSSDGLSLAQEGGHSRRRVAKVKDQTGLAIQTSLVNAVHAHPNITVYEHHMAIDLVTLDRVTPRRNNGAPPEPNRVLGAYALNTNEQDVVVFSAKATILATGGTGKVYLYTSNPDIASGDGIAMAYRAGAKIANMEFMQFHPTCLYHPKAKSFLISEALRGEGGLLRNTDGTRFMTNVHPLAELAPRDIVARAIDHELKKHGAECVFLDMTDHSSDFLESQFPFIFKQCLSLGIDIRTDPIPVVPAAHYTCGGVQIDLRGRTSVPGLWALGETASSGLHGANRLASNSLLECAAYAQWVSADIMDEMTQSEASKSQPELPDWSTGFALPVREGVVISESWDEVRRIMMNYVGIVRSNQRLSRARRRLELIRSEVNDAYWDMLPNGDIIELRNIVTVAQLIVECAMSRKESRGLHFNQDYLYRDDKNWCRDTVLWRGHRGQVVQSLGSL